MRTYVFEIGGEQHVARSQQQEEGFETVEKVCGSAGESREVANLWKKYGSGTRSGDLKCGKEDLK